MCVRRQRQAAGGWAANPARLGGVGSGQPSILAAAGGCMSESARGVTAPYHAVALPPTSARGVVSGVSKAQWGCRASGRGGAPVAGHSVNGRVWGSCRIVLAGAGPGGRGGRVGGHQREVPPGCWTR
jgi:hypothetical protein